jgi:hypothetical protein
VAQLRSPRHRHALAGDFRAPGAQVRIEPLRLHPQPRQGEAGLQLHVDVVAIHRELNELQAHRSIRLGQEAQFAA